MRLPVFTLTHILQRLAQWVARQQIDALALLVTPLEEGIDVWLRMLLATSTLILTGGPFLRIRVSTW